MVEVKNVDYRFMWCDIKCCKCGKWSRHTFRTRRELKEMFVFYCETCNSDPEFRKSVAKAAEKMFELGDVYLKKIQDEE